jgi:ATP-dependent metalloprotease
MLYFFFVPFCVAAKMLGLLRVRSPILKSSHSLSFRHPALLQHRSLSLLIIQQRPTLFQQQRSSTTARFLSLASIFSRPKPTAAPTPLVVAHITRLEAEANVHPHDVSKQLLLFEALSNTKLKSSYDLIITRWERMCEFVRCISSFTPLHTHATQDPSSPLLHSTAAFKFYITCLLITGQQPSINPAVRRRDSLLIAHPLATTSPTLATTELETPATSQEIAQAILSAPPVNSAPSTESTPNLAKLAVGGEAASSNPIQVAIVERMRHLNKHARSDSFI